MHSHKALPNYKHVAAHIHTDTHTCVHIFTYASACICIVAYVQRAAKAPHTWPAGTVPPARTTMMNSKQANKQHATQHNTTTKTTITTTRLTITITVTPTGIQSDSNGNVSECVTLVLLLLLLLLSWSFAGGVQHWWHTGRRNAARCGVALTTKSPYRASLWHEVRACCCCNIA